MAYIRTHKAVQPDSSIHYHIRCIQDEAYPDWYASHPNWDIFEIDATSEELREAYPDVQIEPLTVDDRGDPLLWKWFNTGDSKWYELKVNKHDHQRYDPDTETVINVLPEISENLETEV